MCERDIVMSEQRIPNDSLSHDWEKEIEEYGGKGKEEICVKMNSVITAPGTGSSKDG